MVNLITLSYCQYLCSYYIAPPLAAAVTAAHSFIVDLVLTVYFTVCHDSQAQAEHDTDARPILVATDTTIIEKV